MIVLRVYYGTISICCKLESNKSIRGFLRISFLGRANDALLDVAVFGEVMLHTWLWLTCWEATYEDFQVIAHSLVIVLS